MSGEGTYLSTEKLTVGYDGVPLIREIEMRVRRGEIVTLIGPNGGGKSTILKSITRQLRTIGGCVYLENQALMQMSGRELARRMAVVLTERMRSDLMTCGDIVATGRYPYTGALGILSEEDRQKVRESLRLVHAEELYGRDFTAVSDGQRQRVLLARAICQEPEIIVLDEPTSYLDIRHKLELLTILKRLVRERRVAVIMSLHELDLAQKVSDFVICVHGSYIERAGTPEQVFTPEYIRSLYGITRGSYDALFGCVEMERTEGEPEVFVIAGGGSGTPVFRMLQRRGIPFAAGVLHRNDIDYETAKNLAAEVIAEEAYEPVSEERVRDALAMMCNCKQVICTLESFGTMNQRNQTLLREAQRLGIWKGASPESM